MFGAMIGIAIYGMGVPMPLAILIAVVLTGALAGAWNAGRSDRSPTTRLGL